MPRAQRVNTAIRIHPDIYEKLKAEAEAREVSINYLVNAALKDFLPRLIPLNEFTLVRKDV